MLSYAVERLANVKNEEDSIRALISKANAQNA